MSEWSSIFPETDGLYWFYGFFDEHDPMLMPVAVNQGDYYGVGEARRLDRSLFIGMWAFIPVPEALE